MKKYAIRYAWRDGLHTAIRSGEPFDTHGSFYARAGAPMLHGYLPPEWIDVVDAQRARVDYVIYSYATPIAWHVEGGGWYMPDVRYSVTTGRHQGVVRVALHGLGVTTEVGLFT